MKEDQINRIVNTKRLRLSVVNFLEHYKILIFPILFLFYFYDIAKDSSQMFFDDIWKFGIWLIIVIIVFFIRRKRLQFSSYKGHISQKEIKETLNRTFNELGGHIELEINNYFQIYIKNDSGAYNDYRLTIVILNDKFMVNCISHPLYRSIPFLNRTGNKIIQKFLKHLRTVIDKLPEDKSYLLPEGEWTSKKILTRLYAYPIYLILILLVIFIISEIDFKQVEKAIMAVIVASLTIMYALFYIISDIILIINKKKLDSQHKNKTK